MRRERSDSRDRRRSRSRSPRRRSRSRSPPRRFRDDDRDSGRWRRPRDDDDGRWRRGFRDDERAFDGSNRSAGERGWECAPSATIVLRGLAPTTSEGAVRAHVE